MSQTLTYLRTGRIRGNHIFNKEKIIEVYHLTTDFSEQPKILLKRKLLILLFTIMLMALIFAFDSLIELWFGASKEKII